MSSKPGRNEPCTCGSGQKYKRCCLPREDAARVEALKHPALWESDHAFEEDESDGHDYPDEIVNDVPPFDFAAVRSVRYTRGFARTMDDIEQRGSLRVTEWTAPAIPSSILELFAAEDLESLDGPWGDEAAGSPIQVDLIEIETDDDGIVIEVFNRGLLLVFDNTESTRSIHRICVALERLAAGDDATVASADTAPASDAVEQERKMAEADAVVDFAALRKLHGRQPGICDLCGTEIKRSNAEKHFSQCAPAHDVAKGPMQRLIRMRVTSPGLPAYWLELEMRDDARLTSLDQFLRSIWLECCGHLSQFRVGAVEYVSQRDDFGLPAFASRPQRGMGARLAEALPFSAGRFSYEYDFGSTTVLQFDIRGERQGRIGRTAVRLLARNTPPLWPCAVCGEPATEIDVEAYDYGFLCGRHASGREALLPVVNSPRTGVCGYDAET